MPGSTRELLLTTKAARQWNDAFDQQVDSLIETINLVDTPESIVRSTEVMDVYHHTSLQTTKPTRHRRRLVHGDRPFEFLTFRN